MYDIVALGKLLIDFSLIGKSEQGSSRFEANPGGAPCNVLVTAKSWGIPPLSSARSGGIFWEGI